MKSFMTNWKTTAAGALMIVTGALSLLGVSVSGDMPMDANAALGMIMAGVGLLFAKDGNVTGGSVRQ